ncbi:MAG: RNA-binding protein [Thermodesulfobacteriota bacterium]
MRLYVTNLRSQVTSEDLRNLFESYGEVSSAEIVKTLTTNEPTGLGIVEMKSTSEANTARKKLNGNLLKGNSIKIFDRRITSNGHRETDRRVLQDLRDLADRRQKERRKKTGEEELISLFDKLDRREVEERRVSKQRNLDERRTKERRSGLD